MSEGRVVIKLKPRPWWGRFLRAPWHFWQVLQIGKGRVPLRQRLLAALITTRLLIRRRPF